MIAMPVSRLEPQTSNALISRYTTLLLQHLDGEPPSVSLEIPVANFIRHLEALRYDAFAGEGRAWLDIAPALEAAYNQVYTTQPKDDEIPRMQDDLRAIHRGEPLAAERHTRLHQFLTAF